MKNVVEAGLMCHIFESAIMVVVKEAGPFGSCWQSEIISTDVTHIFDAISSNKKVVPPIVVVIEEPAGKTVDRLSHSGGGGHIRKFPDGFSGSVRRPSPIV